jgi:formate transporter
VACGFEPSVANMFFLPIGMALTTGSAVPLSFFGALSHLVLVTIGTILGGTLLVALVDWFACLRGHSGVRAWVSSPHLR